MTYRIARVLEDHDFGRQGIHAAKPLNVLMLSPSSRTPLTASVSSGVNPPLGIPTTLDYHPKYRGDHRPCDTLELKR